MNHRIDKECGIALIVVMLVMLVFTVMMLGFYYVTTGEQKIAASDQYNGAAYYGAMSGLETMSSQLAGWFTSHASVNATQITALLTPPWPDGPPSVPGITYATYNILCPASPGAPPPGVACTDPLPSTTGTIPGNGPLAGLQGIITPFYLTIVADGPYNTEVKMTRLVQEVAVPIFQYGIFSDSDLSFFAGPNFGFGGRIHTNGNLFLGEDGNTLTLNDKTTAYKDVIRQQLSNGYPTTGGHYGTTIDVLKAANGCGTGLPACRALGLTEGSVTGGPCPGGIVNSSWNNLSLTTYNGWIENGPGGCGAGTGAKKLNLALALAGGQPVELLQRPPQSPPGTYESPSSDTGSARFFNQASLRILLSDQQSYIMNLPAVDGSAQPFPLDETSIHGAPYNLAAADACHPPLAQSPGTGDSDYMLAASKTLLGGYIKIEMQLNATPGTWKDVTKEILGLGISRDAAQMLATTLSTTSGGSLTKNKTYYYVVTALGPWGETTGTEASQNTGSNTAIKLATWTAFGGGATGYRVYRGTSAGGETGYISAAVCGSTPCTTTSTSYTDTGTAPTASPLPSCPGTSIVHLEEAGPGPTYPSSYPLSTNGLATTATNFVPINLYDAREGEVRDTSGPTTSSLNGIMNLVEIDVRNLQQWFAGNIGASGTQALNNGGNGYILYVSDRRMNSCTGTCPQGSLTSPYPITPPETGEFGNEDIINPGSTNGTPNGTLDPPENLDGDGNLYTYGATPHPISTPIVNGSNNWTTFVNSMPATNPAFKRITGSQAQKNSVVIFRRAVRLVNGTLGNLPPLAAAQANPCSGGTAGGFTVAAENPIYVQGDYNASVANHFNDAAPLCHVPAAVLGDAVTLLSNNWTPGAQSGFTSGDANSFAYPTVPNCNNDRCATETWYRMAVLGGKTISFSPLPSWCPSGHYDCGTDGGTHNFLRYIEDWSNTTLNYYGSLASFHYSRQATGIYKCCYSPGTVYQPPTRNYAFDTDFQNISKLPPGTPRFTDVNALSYQQSVLASQ